jgi:type II secretory pathway component PulF
VDTPSSQAFPESELPKWLLRKAWVGIRRAAGALRAPPYKQLALFSHDLRTCIRSSADIVRGLEICLKPFRNTRIGDRWSGAVDQVRRGSTLADALSGADDLLPPFFLPVIKAGEQSGRLDEAFSFLESHCRLLAGPASALRNVWLFPLAIMIFGSLMQVLLHVLMVSPFDALATLVRELLGYGQLFVIVAIAMLTPVRYFIDQVRLSLPWIGTLEREIALHRFFRVLALVYSVGGHRVEEMIQTAAKTVSNSAARIELMKAARAVEEKATIPDAFRRVSILTDDERATIEVGELSGKLEKAFDRISDDTGASMEAKLNFMQPLLVRIVMFAVVMSILGTMLSLIV